MKQRSISVAFMIGDDADVVETLGPWEVFQDAVVGGTNDHRRPFNLYTVAPTRDVVTLTGGLRVDPHFSIDEAPQPDVIVVPAQRTDPDILGWLRNAGARCDAVISVGISAFQLARSGLLDGVPATTHHHYWEKFASEFPHIQLHRGSELVDGGKFLTGRRRTSGRDLALHVVRRYFGEDVARATANYIDHDSLDWRNIHGVARPARSPGARWNCTW